MPHTSLGQMHPVILAQLQGLVRQKLRLFRKITGLTAVSSLTPFVREVEPGAASSLAPPVHPQCAKKIRRLRVTPCGDQWLAHVRASRRSPRAHHHVCPIGLRCTCVPIYFGNHLVGVAKLVAPPMTSSSTFDAAMRVLQLVVSEACLNITVSELTERVDALEQRVAGFQQVERKGGPVGDDAARRKGPPSANSLEGKRILLVNRVLAYLQSHYQEPTLSLAAVAAALKCNPRYLTTRFTQVVGEHMRTYLLALRVTHACRLLIDTDLRVKEIAHASGFTSTGRLTSTFRRHVGVSPLAYRRIFSRTT